MSAEGTIALQTAAGAWFSETSCINPDSEKGRQQTGAPLMASNLTDVEISKLATACCCLRTHELLDLQLRDVIFDERNTGVFNLRRTHSGHRTAACVAEIILDPLVGRF